MTHRPQKYLQDMLDSCSFLIDVSQGKTEQDLRNDRLFRAGVERELQNVGEALHQLQRLDGEMAALIPEHRRIIGMRHVLVHGYDAIEPQTIWYVVTDKLPELREVLRGLLGQA